MIYIGIDPAFRDSGFTIAIIDTEDMTMNFKTFKNGFFDFIGWFLHESPESAVVGVENSNLQDTTFKGNLANIKAFLRQKLSPKKKVPDGLLFARPLWQSWGAIQALCNWIGKLSRDVGKNQCASQYTVDLCKQKYQVLDISPAQKGAKLSAVYFEGLLRTKRIVCTKKRTNQDERDAGKLAVIAMERGLNKRLKL